MGPHSMYRHGPQGMKGIPRGARWGVRNGRRGYWWGGRWYWWGGPYFGFWGGSCYANCLTAGFGPGYCDVYAYNFCW